MGFEYVVASMPTRSAQIVRIAVLCWSHYARGIQPGFYEVPVTGDENVNLPGNSGVEYGLILWVCD